MRKTKVNQIEGSQKKGDDRMRDVQSAVVVGCACCSIVAAVHYYYDGGRYCLILDIMCACVWMCGSLVFDNATTV